MSSPLVAATVALYESNNSHTQFSKMKELLQAASLDIGTAGEDWINEDEGTAYIYHTLSDGTIEIDSYTGKRRYLTVPAQIEGKDVSSIGDRAFAYNNRIRSIELPKTLKKIGEAAFSDCIRLRSIDIPEQVTTIGDGSFYGCVTLSGVGMAQNGKLQSIEKQAFAMCGLSSFTVPQSVNSIGKQVFYGSTMMRSIKVTSGNTNYTIKNQALYDMTGKKLIYYPAGLSGEYTISEGTNEIGDYAFAYSKTIQVHMDGLQSVGEAAFTRSQINKVSIPATITSMGTQVFSNCNYLTEASLSSDCSLKILPSYTFAEAKKLTKVSLNEGLTIIADFAFTNCTKLQTPILPASL